jgi:hypothetical protein
LLFRSGIPKPYVIAYQTLPRDRPGLLVLIALLVSPTSYNLEFAGCVRTNRHWKTHSYAGLENLKWERVVEYMRRSPLPLVYGPFPVCVQALAVPVVLEDEVVPPLVIHNAFNENATGTPDNDPELLSKTV